MESQIENIDPEEILKRLDRLILFLKNKQKIDNNTNETQCKVTN